MESRSTRGFVIRHPRLTLEIALEELDRLHIHEEIIPEKAEELVEKIPHDGVFIHPIIVDRDSLVVLDGMHRVAAARGIGFRYIPVCLVDYASPSVTVGCWYRMFKGLSDPAEAEEILRGLGLRASSRTYEEARRLVERREALTALFTGTRCTAASGPETGIKERYDAIRRVELGLQAAGHHMGYATDRDAPGRVNSGEYSAGLMTPTVTKEEVIDTALSGRVFSQKTTRHIIPARPMFVAVPTEWLGGSLSLDEANRRLRGHLSSKRLVLHPPGQILDRRYDEELYYFE